MLSQLNENQILIMMPYMVCRKWNYFNYLILKVKTGFFLKINVLWTATAQLYKVKEECIAFVIKDTDGKNPLLIPFVCRMIFF